MSRKAQSPGCCKLSSLPISPCAGFVPSGQLWPITVAAADSKSVCLNNNRKDSSSLWVSLFLATLHYVASWFPDQESNPYPLQQKHRILTIGPLGNSLWVSFYWELNSSQKLLRILLLKERSRDCSIHITQKLSRYAGSGAPPQTRLNQSPHLKHPHFTSWAGSEGHHPL